MLDGSALIRLNSLDPGGADPGTATSAAVLAPTQIGPSTASRVSQPGTITRATGQMSFASISWIRQRPLLLIFSFTLLGAGIGGVITMRSFRSPAAPAGAPSADPAKAPKGPAADTAAAPPPSEHPAPAAATAAPPAGNAPSTSAQAQKAGPVSNNSDAAPDEAGAVTAGERHTDKSNRRGHGPNRTDGKRDGKSRSALKPQSTPIIN